MAVNVLHTEDIVHGGAMELNKFWVGPDWDLRLLNFQLSRFGKNSPPYDISLSSGDVDSNFYPQEVLTVLKASVEVILRPVRH